jgi:hypothetical protein
MSEPHQGNLSLGEFNNIWDSLNKTGELSLQTERERKRFIAIASVAKRGLHSGERVILFLQEKNGKRYESARAYECCWGHHTNCYGTGTRIGMYCEALDRFIRFS